MTLRTFSYGGGVQSTAALVLAASGEIDFPLFLFAHVGEDSEGDGTLPYLEEYAKPYAADHGIELHELRRVCRDGSVETLYGRLTKPGSRSLAIPVRMSNGAPGNRSCTADFKIRIIGRWLREHGASAATPATVGIGIFTDEIERVGNRREEPHERVAYPLIDLRVNRAGCAAIIRSAGLPVPPEKLVLVLPLPPDGHLAGHEARRPRHVRTGRRPRTAPERRPRRARPGPRLPHPLRDSSRRGRRGRPGHLRLRGPRRV